MTVHASAAPTPEVAAYWAAKEETNATLRTVRRRVPIVVGLFLAAFLAVAIVTAIKVDAKFSATQRNVAHGVAVIEKVRTVQVSNTKISVARSNCQIASNNAILGDAILALNGDRNAADYAKPMKCS